MADAWTDLEADRACYDAWTVFQQVFNRMTVDTHIAGVVIEKVAAERAPDDFLDLLDRLVLLYDVLCPPPERKEE